MRRAVAVAIAVAALLGAGTARAESCHLLPPLERQALGLRLGVGTELATYATDRYAGEYQGASLSAGWEHRLLHLRAALPVYRIVRNGLTSRGLGDALLDLRIPFARAPGDTMVVGSGIAATVPTGDASKDLGMGHVMLMPGFWMIWRSEPAFVQAQLTYGRALVAGGHHDDAGGHHHHTHPGGGPAPIVNPMNASEVEGAASAGYRLHENLRVRGGVYGAIPVGVDDGAARGAFFAGGDLLAGGFDLGLEAHVPVVGDPFTAKAVMSFGASF